MDNQLSHLEVVTGSLQKEIIVIADHLRTPENIGMLFRVSEAFGVKTVYLINDTPWELTNRKVKKTARNTEEQLTIFQATSSYEIIPSLKKTGFLILGLEITEKSIPIKDADHLSHNKIAIIVGAERTGIEDNTIALLDQSVHIELYGENSSMNVVNALTAGLYELTRC